ncbi:glutamine--fructose-6-phosphate aminotransferase [isomerizing] [bacterium BMS3Bbin02]|nr:glutamine--fructose-6-phosphate aminotransferase [isomerizing] [bacterium BMS3Bbin02]
MCGIMGYVGPQQAATVLLDGLRRLEYRGYDSAGIAVANGAIAVLKAEGKIDRLQAVVDAVQPPGTIGIGHTRWATHGAPSDANAHPHTDASGKFVVVHNGIIENHQSLRDELVESGNVFTSETDTEILAHLVADAYDGDLVAAVRSVVDVAEGAYALVVMTEHEPRKIVAVRRVSPMVVGLGDGETFIASDIPAVLHRTKRFLIVEDGEMVVVDDSGVRITTIDGDPVERDVFVVDWDAGRAEKGGYEHFMLKEIYEQPAVVTETLTGRLDQDGSVWLADVTFDNDYARSLQSVWFTACGTAYHAGLVGAALFRKLLRIPTYVEYAHEMRYNEPLVGSESLTIAVSQSGETADTLAAARQARSQGSRMLALTNVVGSTLARDADDVLYTRAGPEISVASTKAYIAMLVAEYLIALRIGRVRGDVDKDLAAEIALGLNQLPGLLEEVLAREDAAIAAAEQIVDASDVYYLGRGLDYAVAMEGSLKLKEVSYLHSEAMPAGELKHGTLALITEGVPIIAVATQRALYDKTMSAVSEVKARGAHVIAVAYDDDVSIDREAHTVLRIPTAPDLIGPIVAAVPLQLVAYHVARMRGHDIDQPRNLAKSVTVE